MRKIDIATWNYRIFKSGDFYGIVEVYYDADNNPIGYTEFNYPFGFSEVELKSDIDNMLEACKLPTLSSEDFTKNNKKIRKTKIATPSIKNPPSKEIMIKGKNDVK